MAEIRNNSVKYLQEINFATLPLCEKIEIKKLGRTTPDLNIVQVASSRNITYKRKFNKKIYVKHKWLTGCVEINSFFCFPCLLFGGDSTWNKTGVRDVKHINDKCQKHEMSARHLRNVYDLAMIGAAAGTVTQVPKTHKREIKKHNENVKKNRYILSKIIDCLKFCGKFELPLVAHDETNESRNLRGLLDFAGSLDNTLKMHFRNSPAFKRSLKTIQNELLDCVLSVCQDEICGEIKRAKFLSIMTDDWTDASEQIQQVIVFRYELEGAVHERFWGLFNPKSRNSEGLAECITQQLNIVLSDENYKLIAQSYDGATAINGGKSGVHSVIKESYKNAQFVHRYDSEFNLVMQKVSSQNAEARIFFSSLDALPSFFAKSPSRSALLEDSSKHIPEGSNIIWSFNSRVVDTVFDKKEILENCFKTLQNHRNEATVQGATALLHTLYDEDFNFWLAVFRGVMPHVDTLHEQLRRNIHPESIHKTVEEFTDSINCERSKLPSSTIKQEFPSLKRKNGEENILSANEVCDNIILQTKERFAFTGHLSAANLFCPDLFRKKRNRSQFPFTELQETVRAYPFLNEERLSTELCVLYERQEFENTSKPKDIYDVLCKLGISESFVEVTSLLQILITTPMTTAETKDSAATLRRVNAFLGKFMLRDHLSALAMLNVEKNMIENMGDFNEKVIDEFVSQNELRMEFKYK